MCWAAREQWWLRGENPLQLKQFSSAQSCAKIMQHNSSSPKTLCLHKDSKTFTKIKISSPPKPKQWYNRHDEDFTVEQPIANTQAGVWIHKSKAGAAVDGQMNTLNRRSGQGRSKRPIQSTWNRGMSKKPNKQNACEHINKDGFKQKR